MNLNTSVISAVVLLLASANSVDAQNLQCRKGQCISIYECPRMLALLQSKFLTPSIVTQLRQAQCISPTNTRSNSFVCCTETPQPAAMVNTSPRPEQIHDRSLGDGNVLPKECGIEPTTRKIFGGVGVELDEFPWMAVLEYERSKN